MEENTLLNVDLGDTQDLEFAVAPADQEATVRVINVTTKETDNGGLVNLILELVEFPDADYVYYTVWPVRPSDSPRDQKRSRIAIANLCKAFGVDFSGPVNLKEDFINQTAAAVIGTEEYNGITRNKIKSWVVSR